MSSTSDPQFQYKVGGSLERNAPCYVARQADEEFYRALKDGEFCYVLNSRQMGKSSLRVQVMQRLQAEGVACAVIDITSIGSQEITVAEWYLGIIRRLVRGFRVKVDALAWWNGREGLSPVQRLSEFLEDVLLAEVTQKMVIFIDEIDSILKLEFKDDFFALIRACYNQRPDKPEYQRLTFALLGVATPSNLIQDKNRTPFNIGRAIDLQGFQIQEVQPLIQGLISEVEQPQVVMRAILDWTGGQPFLTQKLCQLVAKSPLSIATGQESETLEQLVQSSILNHWESQDDPEHLKTIRDRILNDEQQQGQVLGLYQTVLRQGSITADTSMEQIQLRLSGLVVERQGQLTVYNPIYAAVFNQSWTESVLSQLRPYAAAFTAWEAAERNDESRLLRGNALQEAEAWAAGKSLGEADFQFLRTSEQVENRSKREAMAAANEILATAKRKAIRRLTIASILLGVAVPSAAFFGWRANQAQQQAEAAINKANQADGRADTAEIRVTAAEDREQTANVSLKKTNGQMVVIQRQERVARQKAEVANQAVTVAQQELTRAKQQATEKTTQVTVANQALATVRQQVQAQTAVVEAAKTQVAAAVTQQQQAAQTVDAAKTKLSQVQTELKRREAEFQDIWIFSQGQSALYSGNQEEALKIFNQILARNPQNSFVRISLGNLYSNQKEYEKAVNEFKTVLKIDPRNVLAWNALGNTLNTRKEFDEAIAAYRKAIELNPKYATAYYNMGVVLSAQKKLEEAIAAYQKAIEINPQYAYAYYNLGNILRDQKRLEEAIEAYRQVIKIDPKDPDAYNGLGNSLRDQKKPDEAIVAYRKVIELDPKYAIAYNNLGSALSDQNKLDEAIASYSKAIELDPNYTSAYYNRAIVLNRLKRYKEALEDTDRALKINPNLEGLGKFRDQIQQEMK